MRLLTTTLVVTLASSVSSTVIPSLNMENYDNITDGKIVFIKFFDPWCGHCKKMAPDWEKLADDFKDKEDVLIAEVDCTADGKTLCDIHDIKGYPTLKWGDPQYLQDYPGVWTYDVLSPFAEENLKPICTPEKLQLCDEKTVDSYRAYASMSPDKLDEAIANMELMIKESEKKFNKEVDEIDEIHDELLAIKNKQIALINEQGLSLMKAVKLHRGIQSKRMVSLTPQNYESTTEGKSVFIKFFAPWCGHCKRMAGDWKKLWEEWKYSETGLVAEVDCTADGAELCTKFKVQGYPTLMYGDPKSLQLYEGGRSFEDLLAVAERNLKPQEPSAVHNLTPENYESVTEGKTVFIKFFAPWCNYCKAIAQDWEELAKKWEHDEVGLIAEIDCTIEEHKNWCEEFRIEGYPTIRWGDPAALEDYKGPATFDELSSFAAENLKPICRASRLDLCEGEKKEEIEKYLAMSSEELDELIAVQNQKLKESDEKFDGEAKKVEKKYEELKSDKEKKIAFITDEGLGVMKQVQEYRGVAPKEVPSLTPDNFDSMTEGKYVFLKYFAPWCNHCKNMASAWKKLYQDYAESETVLIAEIDCTAEGEPLCEEIHNFPTLLYGEVGSLKKFTGSRDYDSLSAFAKENLKYKPPSPVKSLTSENYFDMTMGKSVFIKYFAPWCGHCKALAPTWEKLGQEWNNSEVSMIAEVDCTVEGKLCDQHNVKGYPTLRYGDPGALDEYKGDQRFETLSEFAKQNLKPLCSVLHFHHCDEKQMKLMNKFSNMPYTNLKQLIALKEQDLKKAEEKFHNGVKELEAMVKEREAEKQKIIAYITDHGLSLMKEVQEFRSVAPKPAPSLTPENYDSMTEGKFVFIKFFAPWCGHCKGMAKDFMKLSHEYEDSETILIAEVDCTADGDPLCKEHGVQGYPTLKYGNPKSLELYDKGRSVDEMSAFVKRTLVV